MKNIKNMPTNGKSKEIGCPPILRNEEGFEKEFNRRSGYYNKESRVVLTLEEGLYKAYKIGFEDGKKCKCKVDGQVLD